MCNVNSVSDSCKIGLKGYDFLKILCIQGCFSCKILYHFWISYVLTNFAKFCDFFFFITNFVFEASSKLN